MKKPDSGVPMLRQAVQGRNSAYSLGDAATALRPTAEELR